MPYWLIGAILLVSASAFAASRAGRLAGGQRKAPFKNISSSKMLGISMGEVELMLEHLEESDEPEPIYGAMCYEAVAGPSVLEYICPTCGERTLYEDYSTIYRVEDVFSARSLMDELASVSDLALVLDESLFCASCHPEETEASSLRLIVEYDGGETDTTEVTTFDLRLLLGFLAGDDSYETSTDGVMPLKPHLSRIREILGFPVQQD